MDAPIPDLEGCTWQITHTPALPCWNPKNCQPVWKTEAESFCPCTPLAAEGDADNTSHPADGRKAAGNFSAFLTPQNSPSSSRAMPVLKALLLQGAQQRVGLPLSEQTGCTNTSEKNPPRSAPRGNEIRAAGPGPKGAVLVWDWPLAHGDTSTKAFPAKLPPAPG